MKEYYCSGAPINKNISFTPHGKYNIEELRSHWQDVLENTMKDLNDHVVVEIEKDENGKVVEVMQISLADILFIDTKDAELFIEAINENG